MDGLNQQEGESGQLKEVKHHLARRAQQLHINTTDLSLAGAATSMIFVATKVLSGEICVCRDKTRLLSRQTHFCRDKNIFVAK